MYIGVYLCLSGLFLIICLLILPRVRRRLGLFIGLSLLTIISPFVLFELLSIYLNIVPAGENVNFNYPADYVDKGIIGWFVTILPLLGILSPIMISLLLTRQSDKSLP
jgi:hypothetical protein